MNVKLIGAAAGSGFALSFLTGIISGNAVTTVLVKAVIFALIFAVLAVLISFLFDKFLADASGSSVASGSFPGRDKTGGNVDIVISDDNLDDDDSGPKFYVENNRQSLAQTPEEKQAETGTEQKEQSFQNAPPSQEKKEEQNAPDSAENLSSEVSEPVENEVPLTQEKEAPEAAAQPQGFVSAPLQEVAGTEKDEAKSTIARDVPSNAGDGANKVNSYADGANIENIDALPDIGELNDGEKSDGVNDIISDSDFATRGSSSSLGASFPNGTEASAANADVMAQAIRTLLKKDD